MFIMPATNTQNFNYPVAQELSTPSSLSYLSFLASNVRQVHLNQLKTQGAAKATVISSEIDANTERATVVCQIKNVLIINPVNGKTKQINTLQDTLELTREYDKWLIKKDIPLRNGKQNHD